MGIFKEKQSVSRGELKESLSKSSGAIPKTGGGKYPREQREGLEKEVFDRKYGSQISKRDYRDALKELKSAKREAKSRDEKTELENKTRYLKKLGGV